MAWIESHQTLKEHPKLYSLMSALNVSRSAAIGHLHLLWWWAVDYATDGELHVDENQIARAAEWLGDPKTLHDALVSSGFIDCDENGKRLHDWLDYCGQLVEKRLQRLEDKRRKTASVRRPSASVRRKKDAYPTLPNPTVPNPTEPNPNDGANGSKTHRSLPQSKLSDDDWFAELKKTYTWLDVDREHAKAKAWMRTHAGRQFTQRFFVNWLNRVEKPVCATAPQDPGVARLNAMADAAERQWKEQTK